MCTRPALVWPRMKALISHLLASLAFVGGISPPGDLVDDGHGWGNGCLSLTKRHAAPENPYQISVNASPHFPPWGRTVEVYGHTLLLDAPGWHVEEHDVCWIAQFHKEMFPALPEGSVAHSTQIGILSKMHMYGAASYVFPVKGFHPEGYGWHNVVGPSHGKVQAEVMAHGLSSCDTVSAGIVTGSQCCEILKHVLHAYSVGLAYQFQEQWGFSTKSKVYKQASIAMHKGYYKGQDYRDDIVMFIKKFEYHALSTYWNVKETCCSERDGGEFNLNNSDDLKQSLPDVVLLVESTIGTAMVPPSTQTLSYMSHIGRGGMKKACPLQEVFRGSDEGGKLLDDEHDFIVFSEVRSDTQKAQDLKTSHIINGVACPSERIKIVDQWCKPRAPHYDKEGRVCGCRNQGYCSYDVGPHACARCAADVEDKWAMPPFGALGLQWQQPRSYAAFGLALPLLLAAMLAAGRISQRHHRLASPQDDHTQPLRSLAVE